MEEKSYTSTHPLGHTGPVTGSLYLIIIIIIINASLFGKGWKLPAPPNQNRVTISHTLSLDVSRLVISNPMSSYLVAIDPRFLPPRPTPLQAQQAALSPHSPSPISSTGRPFMAGAASLKR